MIRVGQLIMFNYFISKTRLIAVTPRTGSGLDAAGRRCRRGWMLLSWAEQPVWSCPPSPGLLNCIYPCHWPGPRGSCLNRRNFYFLYVKQKKRCIKTEDEQGLNTFLDSSVAVSVFGVFVEFLPPVLLATNPSTFVTGKENIS